MLNGRDLRSLQLVERKAKFAAIMPAVECRVLFLDSIAERGVDLFREACRRDLEGIVAKYSQGTYQSDGKRTSWTKIRNPDYSQIVGREDLFESRQPLRAARQSTPVLSLV